MSDGLGDCNTSAPREMSTENGAQEVQAPDCVYEGRESDTISDRRLGYGCM